MKISYGRDEILLINYVQSDQNGTAGNKYTNEDLYATFISRFQYSDNYFQEWNPFQAYLPDKDHCSSGI
jgi:hypothetical protein